MLTSSRDSWDGACLLLGIKRTLVSLKLADMNFLAFLCGTIYEQFKFEFVKMVTPNQTDSGSGSVDP